MTEAIVQAFATYFLKQVSYRMFFGHGPHIVSKKLVLKNYVANAQTIASVRSVCCICVLLAGKAVLASCLSSTGFYTGLKNKHCCVKIMSSFLPFLHYALLIRRVMCSVMFVCVYVNLMYVFMHRYYRLIPWVRKLKARVR